MTFQNLMKALSFIYAGVGLSFYFLHSFLESLVGLETAPNLFWLALTLSMMAMLSLTAWYSSRSPKQAEFVHLHLLSKAASVTGFVLANLTDRPRLAYGIGALVDLAILGLVYYSFRKFNERSL